MEIKNGGDYSFRHQLMVIPLLCSVPTGNQDEISSFSRPFKVSNHDE